MAALTVILLGGAVTIAAQRVISPSQDTAPAPDTTVGGTTAGGTTRGTAPAVVEEGRRDDLASAPMVAVHPDAMWPAPAGGTRLGAPSPVTVPAPRSIGEAHVATGFPPTPEGALAQLSAIYRTVLQAMDPAVAREVHAAWRLEPTGPWSLTTGVSDLHDRAGVGTGSEADLRVTAEPVAAVVKATDGPDWVVACVLMQVRAAYRATGEVALGRCERMQWSTDRWLIAPGDEPAPAPSTWPGTSAADQAGWRPLLLGGPPTLNTGATPAQSQAQAETGSGTGAAMAPSVAGLDIPNPLADPLAELGSVIAGGATDAWTSVMLAIWGGGLWLLRLVLTLADMFLTPDLSETGPGNNAYASTFWLASALVLVLVVVQLGVAAFRRDGRSIARLLVGAAQFVLVWCCWLGYCVLVVSLCGDLTHALMQSLLGVESWNAWDPVPGLQVSDVSDAAVATVLGLLGCVLWLAALGHLLVLVARAASLVVLVATGPIAAAGLVSEVGRAWFWKSLRWFHAAALTPLLMVLVLGLGAQFSAGVAEGLTDSAQAAIGTALPSLLLLCTSCVAPLALFKMLSFVDPGTASGASFRQGMAAQGGVQGLLRGRSDSPGTAAARSDAHGRSEGEGSAGAATEGRFASSLASGLRGAGASGATGLLGGIGLAVSTGMSAVQRAGAVGSSLMADESNQAGVGHHTHGPDFTSLGQSGARGSVPCPSGPAAPPGGARDEGPARGDDGDAGAGGSGGPPASVPSPAMVAPSLVSSGAGLPGAARAGKSGTAPLAAGGSPATTPGAGGSGGTAGGGGAAESGIAAAVTSVPPVPL